MDRRQVLTSCAAGIAGLAGCSARSDGGATSTDDGTPTGDVTPTPDGDTTLTPTPRGAELQVAADALQAGVVGLNVDAYGIVSEADRQYLFVNVAADSGPPPSRATFAFRFDGDEHPPGLPDAETTVRRADGTDTARPWHYPSGWLLFALPETGDASDAALVRPGGEWRPDDRLQARLAAPLPELALREWRVPETVALGGRATFGFTVRNKGDQEGRFVAVINAEGWYPIRPVAIVSRQIPAGKTRSWTLPAERIKRRHEEQAEAVDDGDPDVQYRLIRPGGDSDVRSVRVVDGS